MFSFQLNGWFGAFMMLILALVALFFAIVLPSMITTALWNALVFETFHGVKIGFLQGSLLWAMAVFTLLLWFKPSIQFDLRDMDDMDLDTMDSLDPPKKSNDNERSEHWKKWRKSLEEKEKPHS